MGEITNTEIFDILSSEMELSFSMKNRLRQICIYADIAGIDMESIRKELIDKGVLPCTDKNGSKKALAEIYDNVACAF